MMHSSEGLRAEFSDAEIVELGIGDRAVHRIRAFVKGT